MLEIAVAASCALIELGLPVAAVLASRKRPSIRLKAVVILGAVTPLVASYVYILGQQVLARGAERTWAFGAVWSMTFTPYVVCALLGFGLSFVPRPEHLGLRYVLGLTVPFALAALLLVGP